MCLSPLLAVETLIRPLREPQVNWLVRGLGRSALFYIVWRVGCRMAACSATTSASFFPLWLFTVQMIVSVEKRSTASTGKTDRRRICFVSTWAITPHWEGSFCLLSVHVLCMNMGNLWGCPQSSQITQWGLVHPHLPHREPVLLCLMATRALLAPSLKESLV